MFLIRRIFDDVLAQDREALEQVHEILREQFPGAPERDLRGLRDKLANPFKQRFRTILFVAEKAARRKVRGCAVVAHAPEEHFCFLDYLASAPGRMGGGIGGALYERVRQEARALGALGLFFECGPDQPELCPDPELRRVNARRLAFYERFGARPLVGNAYATPVGPGDGPPPLLVYDPLAHERAGEPPGRALARSDARRVVRAILERKYAHLCPPAYVEAVVGSFQDDPVQVRAPLYWREPELPVPPRPTLRELELAYTVNEAHQIHHVRERGYVESPVRVASIERGLERLPFLRRLPVLEFADRHVEAVHDREFVRYLRTVCAGLSEGTSVYPYVFPIRNATRPPLDLATRAGYYCIDTFTPLDRNAWPAARAAVDCALTAARALQDGHRLAYALVRPPGHHAERRSFGGFCYLNSAAIAAQFLLSRGPVAMLDIDYHHGNGQQDIFYERRDVLTLSIHGHPRFAYPYFTGFDDERGRGEGEGFNRNYPLPEQVDGPRYREALARALRRVRAFRPTTLVVLLGFDTARGDPTGSWTLTAKDFAENGRLIGAQRLPTLVVQEGGYRTRTLGTNARYFFHGLYRGMLEAG